MLTLWQTLSAPAGRRFILALSLSALAGAAGVILLGLSGWFLTAASLAGAAGAGFTFNHLYPSAGVRAAAFTRVLARYGEQLVGHDATLALSARLRPALFEAAARSGRGMTAMETKELSALIDDVDEAEAGFLRVLSPAAAVAASILVALCFTFAADFYAGMTAIAAIVIFAILLPRRAVEQSNQAASNLNAETESARGEVAGLVENAIELDILGALPAAADSACKRLDRALAKEDKIEAPFRAIGALGSAAGLLLALLLINRASESETGLAIAVGAALSLIAAFDASAAMVKIFDAVSRSRFAVQKLNARLSVADAPWEAPRASSVALQTIFPLSAEALVVKAGDRAPVIGPLSFTISPGEVLQIIGPSGCGKTTVAETLMRLHPLAGGGLLYAGVASQKIRIAAALQRIAMSPQFPSFLPGTLEDQLRLAAPAATDTEIQSALATACIDQVVTAKSKGLQTEFDEGGAQFSGGELRRLGLARALLVNPELLVLDEPFAGLDAPLAKKLADKLASWMREEKRALVILAHEPQDKLFGGAAMKMVRIGADHRAHQASRIT
ncbi:MAG: ATP-binding cassette domain-containing protein [Parvularculaceae bacterium]